MCGTVGAASLPKKRVVGEVFCWVNNIIVVDIVLNGWTLEKVMVIPSLYAVCVNCERGENIK